jgi:hypothetical protein
LGTLLASLVGTRSAPSLGGLLRNASSCSVGLVTFRRSAVPCLRLASVVRWSCGSRSGELGVELSGLLGAHCGPYLPGWSAPAGANQWSLTQEVHRGKRAPSMVSEQRGSCYQVRRIIERTPVVSHGLSMSVLSNARSAHVVLSKRPSNPSLQGTVQQRRCRCRPAPELWRWVACRRSGSEASQVYAYACVWRAG